MCGEVSRQRPKQKYMARGATKSVEGPACGVDFFCSFRLVVHVMLGVSHLKLHVSKYLNRGLWLQ